MTGSEHEGCELVQRVRNIEEAKNKSSESLDKTSFNGGNHDVKKPKRGAGAIRARRRE